MRGTTSKGKAWKERGRKGREKEQEGRGKRKGRKGERERKGKGRGIEGPWFPPLSPLRISKSATALYLYLTVHDLKKCHIIASSSKEEHLTCKITEWWGAGVVICLG